MPGAPPAPPAPAAIQPAPEPDPELQFPIDLEPETATATAPDVLQARPAPLWRRACALAVDAALVGGVGALYLLIASAVAGLHVPSTHLTGLDAFAVWVDALRPVLLPGAVLVALLALAYCAFCAFSVGGRTLGRSLLKIRLVDLRGRAPSPARSVLRAVLSLFSFALGLGGFWMALFDGAGQTLHDKLTSTYVIRPL